MNVFLKGALRQARGIIALGSIVGGACALHAITPSPDYTAAQTYLYNSLGSVVCFQPDSTTSSCSGNGSSANAVVTDSHGGSAYVRIGDDGGSGVALTAYSFGFFGPKEESIPIKVTGFASTDDGYLIDGYGYASYTTYEYSDLTIKWSDNYIASQNGCIYISNFSNSPCQQDGNFTISSSVNSNEIFVVVLQSVAIGMNSWASIDPIISIDPSFADANLFAFESSPGVFTSTPEPSYGPVFFAIGCLSVIALRLRGRRSSQ